MCSHFVKIRTSSTNQPRSSSAILRYELVISPTLLSLVTSLWQISCGYSTCHTVGSNGIIPGIHTPTAPSLEASSDVMTSESPYTCVGSAPASPISCFQSLKFWRAAGCLSQNTSFRFSSRMWFKFPNRFFPYGIPIAVCRSFPSSFSSRLNSTPDFMQSTVLISVIICCCLFSDSLMHLVAPSIIHPSTSFQTVHTPSPLMIFFIKIGSFPEFPEMCGGVNTL